MNSVARFAIAARAAAPGLALAAGHAMALFRPAMPPSSRTAKGMTTETSSSCFSKRITNIRRNIGPALLSLVLVGGIPELVSAQSVNARENRIVGLWDVQVTNFNCATGVPLASFRALHKYELGGTGQVVPATNPAALSAHMVVWRHVQGNHYQMTVKMFRFDAAGNNIGWVIIKNDVAISEDATDYAGDGQAEIFDPNGNSVGGSCPAFAGTRFVGG